MKKLLSIVSTVLFSAVFAAAALAAEVKTPYFSLDLPDPWIQPQDVVNQNNALVALFQNKTNGTAVTLTVVNAAMPARDVAEQTVSNMKAGGMESSKINEENGLYTFSFAKGQGVSWVGSNGEQFAVTTVVGPDVASAKAMLKGLKPASAKLFPSF